MTLEVYQPTLMVLKFQHILESPGLVKALVLESFLHQSLEASIASLGWDLIVYMSNMFPEHADATGWDPLRTTSIINTHIGEESAALTSTYSQVRRLQIPEILNTVHLMT